MEKDGEKLPTTPWAHRIAKSQATGALPFSLVYGIEAVILIDLLRSVVKLAEIVEDKCDNTISYNRLYLRKHEGEA